MKMLTAQWKLFQYSFQWCDIGIKSKHDHKLINSNMCLKSSWGDLRQWLKDWKSVRQNKYLKEMSVFDPNMI